jgi:hypothetical protein
VSDASHTSAGRSSVLYALGRLEAQNDEQRKEIASLPGRIAEMFTPRLVAVEATLMDHGKRLTVVERRIWLAMGAVATVTTLIGIWEVAYRA